MRSLNEHRSLPCLLALTLAATSSAMFAAAAGSTPAPEAGQSTYFPPRGEWETRTPEQLGMDAAMLQEAIEFALARQNPGDRDLGAWLTGQSFGSEPFFELFGPTTVRADMNGLMVKDGYIVAEWGESKKVDMTFSVSKTFLSTTVGLAWDRGMIRSLDDRAVEYMPTDELFAAEHNRKITWDDLLRQTSDWRGTLFDMPAWADRPARRNAEGGTASWIDIQNVPLSEPGTAYEYNDVRVNLLALVALNVWREPLPQVLREYVMDPIGASNTWRWHGYRNSWVDIDGQMMQSVSGGGHWGGGMHISARDMARFGYLFLNDGVWNGERIISRGVDRDGTHARARESDVRLHELVPQPRRRAQRPGAALHSSGVPDCRHLQWRRQQLDLCRQGKRSGDRRTLDSGRLRRVFRQGARRDQRELRRCDSCLRSSSAPQGHGDSMSHQAARNFP